MSQPAEIFIGCGEWGFRDLPLQEHFAIAARLGFKVMEFGIGGGQPGRLPESLAPSQIDAFVDLCHRHQITTPFCCLENDFTLPDVAAHDRMLQRTLDQIELAQRLGATHVRLFTGFTPIGVMTQAIWNRMLAAFNAADELCQSLGLVIAIETHGKIELRNGVAHHTHTVTTDRDALARLVKSLPETVMFNYDPGNLKAVEPDDHRYALDLIGDRIGYCHLKDWRRSADGWEAVAIGDDDLDYARLLPQLPYRGILLIEYEPTADVEAGIMRSLDYLTRAGIDWAFGR